MNLFTYGSLMYPQVWTRVMNRAHPSRPATIQGYARHGLAGEVYPALLESPGSSVQGVLYSGLAEAELERLDRFEGEDYRRMSVRVLLDGDGEEETFVYVYTRPEKTSPELWDPVRFETEGMEHFLNTYVKDRG
jgi:gamma-glutamylcyclotransferase (GGCT)/AIG2-like uncharacterized protein YtfP